MQAEAVADATEHSHEEHGERLAHAAQIIEANVDERGLLSASQTCADGDLTVFDLSESPIVLPGHANGAVAFFGEPRVIDDEPATRPSAQEPGRADGNLIHERTVVAWRVRNGIVNRLLVEIRHMLLHAIEVLCSAFGLHEPKQIGANLISIAVATCVEKVNIR